MFKSLLENLKSFLLRPLVIAIIVFVLVVAAAVFLFFQYNDVKSQLNQFKADPQALVEKENQALIGNVGRLVELPSDEDPTIATITDVERLKEQAFFAKAENGDKILIYADAKRAILYRPDTNKIIEVAPVNIGDQSGLQTDSNKTEPLKVGILNGTDSVSLGAAIESKVESAQGDYQVVQSEKANNSYGETVVVRVSGSQAAADSLAQSIGAKVSDLPEGEKSISDVDLVVLIGSDQK